ncbi:50S ribosomal protein L25 [Phaeodactylibacter luteus]|uniref:Large ribosomal subunit protein bL25 n=1 Tax=Phaeodactylibacter luteus TaxID=1564516 RepID=A0A5C6RKK7_9BACT|nr:50S ribosomal protein L25 [Phaeodactylibacter luteus]TXB62475.1 50S ribosomal protein L25 [Phaeodactylibacter luteus]
METIALTGQARTDLGKKATNTLRKEGHIPCVAYGGGDAVHFSVQPKDVKHLIYTPDFKLAEVSIDGKSFKAFVKDLQFHPVTDEILHIDFLRLIEGTPVKVDVPIRFKGTSPGVKAGGKLVQRLRRIRIKTKPEHMVGDIQVDISKLQLNESIRIRDIDQKLETVEIMNSPGVPVASIETPRALRSAAAAAAKAEKG